MLILPGTLAYALAIEELPLPPGWEQMAHKAGGQVSIVAIPGTGGIMRCVSWGEAEEFVEDGQFAAICEEESSPFEWVAA